MRYPDGDKVVSAAWRDVDVCVGKSELVHAHQREK